MAIGEALTAELMGGLIYHAARLGTPAAIVEQLKDVNNVRPMLHVFEWLEWLGAHERREDQERLDEALRLSLDGLLGCSLARKWDRMRTDLIVSADLNRSIAAGPATTHGSRFQDLSRPCRRSPEHGYVDRHTPEGVPLIRPTGADHVSKSRDSVPTQA
jgi:hypothetical protein